MKVFKYENNIFWHYLFVALIIFLFFEILFSVLFLNTWFDEADFGYKAWLTSQNMAMPFTDFYLKHPPVSFYSQVWLQGLFGPSLLAGRIFSAVFLLGIVFLIFDICRRMGGKWLGLLGASFLIFHPYLISNYSSALPYSLSMFFVLLSIWVIGQDKISDGKKILLSSAVMSMSVLSRYNMLPALIVLWIFVFLKWRNYRYLSFSVGGSLATMVLFLIPFWLIDPQYTVKTFFDMFGPLVSLIPASWTIPSIPGAASDQFWGSRLEVIVDVFGRYFHLWIIFIVGVIYSFKKGVNSFLKKNDTMSLSVLLFLSLFVTHFFYFNGPQIYPIYSLYFVPLLLLSAAGFVGILFDFLKREIKEEIFNSAVVIITVILIFSSFSVAIFGHLRNFSNPFHYSDSDLNRIEEGAEFIRLKTDDSDIILTLDDPHHIFIASGYEIPQLINKFFSYRKYSNKEHLNRLKYYNLSMFIDWMDTKATIVVFQRGDLDNRLDKLGINKDYKNKFINILENKYKLAGSIDGVYPRKYKQGEGTMDIYIRK